ncbi:putative indole-3-pyruvate monooxygenase YUCCA4 [Cyphellophora attinorum]|uniref:Putative indole-3-pyruvate monooxygenase YUCCA4 n=1 Tax=Cyphellophora attinorum TaxID=1664694 RepID=A0A0N1HNE5_9EURO|nr:putative indole-3-pyruvate monooxygenase YUCCA4 [Phialophora attinorum]KPI39014.1 putative indole-3-pyruvate monooxygenase YUCCA4 [Phialophora attinorum]
MEPHAPPMASIPPLTLADGLDKTDVDANEVASLWLKRLQKAFDANYFANLDALFLDECWWRDQIALSWDTRAAHGLVDLRKYLSASDHGLTRLQPMKSGGLKPVLLDNGGLVWIQTGFTFIAKYGVGEGILHLVNVAKDQWKAWLVLTQLQRLHEEGHPDWDINVNGIAASALKEPVPPGMNGTTNNSSATHHTDANDNGDHTKHEPDYQVIIIGAGQSGLALAAHLKNRGITYLIIDKQTRIGDSWRARYKTITSHTPTYTDHYPFLRFPEDYPKWLNQEKITNWQEGYARIMELNLRLGTEVTHVDFDDANKKYTLSLGYGCLSQQHTKPKALTCRHLVLCTGMFSTNPITPAFPSQSSFKGQIYHAKYHKSATTIHDLANKKIAIIGAGTSAHDIAEDFAANGPVGSITMIQRGAIFAVSRPSMERHLTGMWDSSSPSGLSTAEADLLSHSFPFPVLRTMSIGQTMQMCAEEKDTLDKLAARGMRLKRGETGEGMIDHQFIKGGHFYIDQGAWRHLVEGAIKVASCDGGVEDIDERGVVLADGRVIQADVVILATGYERCWTYVRDLLGEETLDRVSGGVSKDGGKKDFGGLDEESERVGWWRPTGQKGLWYMTGSFLLVRQFSALVALQIDAVERGLNERYWSS